MSDIVVSAFMDTVLQCEDAGEVLTLLGVDPNGVGEESITSNQLADASVNVDKLASDSVTQVKIATGAVGTDEIANANVTLAKMAADSVDTSQIKDNAVTLAKMADSSVGTNELVAASVTQAKHANDSVGTAQLIAANVTQAKLANDAVGTSQIIAANVTQAKMATDSVGTAQLIAANVTAAKMASDSIATANVLDSNITDPKVALSVMRIVHGVAQASVTLSGSAGTIDGVTFVTGTIIMVMGNTVFERGPWVVNTAGAWTRPTWHKSGSTQPAGIGIMSVRGTRFRGATFYSASSAVVDAASNGWTQSIYTHIPYGYLSGCIVSSNISDASILNISSGVCYEWPDQSDANVNGVAFKVPTFAKKANTAWAVGTGNGALDTGTFTSGNTYYLWVIRREDTGLVDFLVSTSHSAPNYPTNYTVGRPIAVMRADSSSTVYGFWQALDGDTYHLRAPLLDIDTTVGSAGFTGLSLLSVPTTSSTPEFEVFGNLAISNAAASVSVEVVGDRQTQQTPSITATPLGVIRTQVANIVILASVDNLVYQTSLYARATANTTTIRFVPKGYRWRRNQPYRV